LLALAQGPIPAYIPLPAKPLAHRLTVTQPARDCHLIPASGGQEMPTAGPPAAHIEKPSLACCIASASTSHTRVPQLSVGCSGPFRGVQARDCNLLQTGKSATSGWVAAARRCSGKTTRKWLRLQGKLDTHPNCVSELFKAVRSYSDRCRCPRDLISGRF
jgi:hypothetical protein